MQLISPIILIFEYIIIFISVFHVVSFQKEKVLGLTNKSLVSSNLLKILKEGFVVRFVDFTVMTMRILSSGMWRSVALVSAEILEECIASIIRVTTFGELGTMSAVTSNRNTLQRNTSETLVITRATWWHIREYNILHMRCFKTEHVLWLHTENQKTMVK
jgi:hypothetical protein